MEYEYSYYYEYGRKYILNHPNHEHYKIEYFGHWVGYEESGWMIILSLEDKYYYLRGGYSVMNDDYEYDELSPIDNPLEEIHIDQAIEEIELMENHIKEHYYL